MKLDCLADALVSREHEAFAYQINIDNYTAMLAVLPQGEWPTEIVQFRTVTPNDLPPDMPIATAITIGEFQFRDKLRLLLRTENVEKSKSQRVLEAVKAQIPADKMTLTVDAAVARRAAALARV